MRTTSSNNIIPISRAAISVLVENFQKKQRVQELVRELAKKLAKEQTKKNLPKAKAKVEFIQFRFSKNFKTLPWKKYVIDLLTV